VRGKDEEELPKEEKKGSKKIEDRQHHISSVLKKSGREEVLEMRRGSRLVVSPQVNFTNMFTSSF